MILYSGLSYHCESLRVLGSVVWCAYRWTIGLTSVRIKLTSYWPDFIRNLWQKIRVPMQTLWAPTGNSLACQIYYMPPPAKQSRRHTPALTGGQRGFNPCHTQLTTCAFFPLAKWRAKWSLIPLLESMLRYLVGSSISLGPNCGNSGYSFIPSQEPYGHDDAGYQPVDKSSAKPQRR